MVYAANIYIVLVCVSLPRLLDQFVAIWILDRTPGLHFERRFLHVSSSTIDNIYDTSKGSHIHLIVLPILTYKYYVRFCELKAAVIFALTCYALQATLKKSGILRPKHFNMVVATVVALFVLTFDWSLILEKFSDGTMWQVLLTNTICYAVLCWEIIWINFGHLWADVNIIAGKKQSFRQLIFRWEKYMVLGMAKLSCMIIIASFYYPVTVM